jgi:hypothetical protein
MWRNSPSGEHTPKSKPGFPRLGPGHEVRKLILEKNVVESTKREGKGQLTGPECQRRRSILDETYAIF